MEGLGIPEKKEGGRLNPEGFVENISRAKELLVELETFVGTSNERREFIKSIQYEVDDFVRIAKDFGEDTKQVARDLQEALRILNQMH